MRLKKQCVALLLGLCMLFACMLPAVADTQAALTLSLVEAEGFANGQEAHVTLLAENDGDAPVQAAFFLALYETDTNRMEAYTYVMDTVSAGADKQWGAGMPIPDTGSYYMKAFAWDDPTGASLVSNVLEIAMGQTGPEEDVAERVEAAILKTGAYVAEKVPSPSVGMESGDWAVFALARAGVQVPAGYYDGYYERAAQRIASEAAKEDGVWDDKVTEVQRVALALTAIGKDPRDVGGEDLLDYSYNKADHFPGIKPDGELGSRQGANELIYALLSVQAHDAYAAPAEPSMDEAEMVDALLSYKAEGGFALSEGGALNADVTAMAVQALAKAYDQPAVKEAVDTALATLSELQSADGQIATENGEVKSLETVAQTIVALTELGMDPDTDARFVKGENSLVDALFAYAEADGSFRHLLTDEESSQMATEQALYALAALDRFYAEKNTLYDMNDVTLTSPAPAGIAIPEEALAANAYETFYYLADQTYLYQGQTVTFVSESEMQAGDQTYPLRNKAVEVTVKTAEDGATIGFTGLTTPVGSVSDKWNLGFGGAVQIAYQSDIPGQAEVRSENENLTELVLSDLPAGTYHLTNGAIYEAANEWSPGIDFGDGKGTVKEGYFGTLPDLTITVAGKPTEEPVGTVSVSIEKRTIGKGDTLPLMQTDLYAGESAWDLLSRVSAAQGIAVKTTGNGDAMYVSAIDGDGEYDYGSVSGWMYCVNDEMPWVGIANYQLQDGDVLRMRYYTAGSMQEDWSAFLPLVDRLAYLIDETNELLASGSYTESSRQAVEEALAAAQPIVDDPQYDSTETEKELVVNEYIGRLMQAVDGLVPGNEEPPSDSEVPDDWENDLWLQYDFKEMSVGDTADIYPRRVPQAVADVINNDVERPNFRFEIVSGDSIALEEVPNSTDPSRTDKVTVTAVKEGVSIVKVSYDAFTHSQGTAFGACSPVNETYAIFHVAGADCGIAIDPGEQLKATRSYDTIYFDKGDTVDYTIKPVVTGADSVTVTVNGKTVEANPNGSYTLPLESRANIIGISAQNSTGATCYYQVVDARKMEIQIVNKTHPGEAPRAGDTLNISFRGITPPMYKLATIYNPYLGSSDQVEYTNAQLGTVVGKSGQGDLATNNDFDVVVEEAGTYQFTGGRILSKWFGEELGEDKNIQGQGNPNLGAGTHEGYFSTLPDFAITVAAAE